MRKVKQYGKRFMLTPTYKAKRKIENKDYYEKHKNKWEIYNSNRHKNKEVLNTIPV
jgi:hypothetical protein